ncbi:hypothetical protein Tco_0915695 [Tanacetum coccineum]
MTTLKFADTHNMVAFLSKPTESDGFEQIVDFLNAHPIRYALTINPTIYISCIEQFWSIIMAKTINGEEQLHALVDGKKIIITESSVRRDIQLAYEEGVDYLPNFTIFEQLTLMGKPKRKDTQVPQPSDPIENVAYEAVHKELGNSLVRAATTASSLEAEQDSGGPWCQETIGDTIAQTRVKKLEKKDRSRIHRLKRLYKVGLASGVESSNDEESLGEDASKHGMIDAIDADEEITLVSVHDVNVSAGEGVFATTVDDITLAQDKGKGILIEPVKPMNKKDLIRLDEETALNLQDEFDEEERLVREKAEKEEEANIALIETWDDIHAKIDADHQLAKRMQAQE